MISEATLSLIKERANLMEIAAEFITLKRQGSSVVALCPFHAEKTPSFHIRGEGSYFHCFGCGVSGNAISFLMQIKGISFPEAVEELAGRYSIPIERDKPAAGVKPRVDRQIFFQINAAAYRFFRAALGNAPAAVKEYLAGRGLNADVVNRFGIGFAPESRDGLAAALRSAGFKDSLLLGSGLVRRNERGEIYDLFRARVIFPVWQDNRHICGFGGRIIPPLFDAERLKSFPKYLNSPESPVYQKNKTLFAIPQALEAIRREGEVFLVEGYMDVIGLWKGGVQNAIATCGTAVTENHVKRLSRLTRRVEILFDGDQAGRSAAGRCFELFLNSGLEAHAIFLEGGHDPDSLAALHGEKTRQCLKAYPRFSLLEAHILALLEKYGVKEVRELGAASKGRLCEELAGVLARVRNPVERDELLRTSSLRLGTDLQSMASLAPRVPERAAVPSIAEAPSGRGKKEVSELPAVDQQILYAVMVLKRDLSSRILRDADACLGLEPATLGFVESLDLILSAEGSDEVSRKDAIKALLHGQGPSWVEHWKKAYRMNEEEEVDFSRSFEECCRTLRKNKIIQALTELDRQLSVAVDEQEKISLSQEKVILSRSLRET